MGWDFIFTYSPSFILTIHCRVEFEVVMESLGVPVQLKQDCLPTKRDIFNHYLYLRNVKQESGEWKQNTSLSVAVTDILSDVKKQWEKTQIPHTADGRRGEKDLLSLLTKFQTLSRVNAARRGPEYGKEMDLLYDVAVCPHGELSACSCPLEHQV